jgi:hypothetical protein
VASSVNTSRVAFVYDSGLGGMQRAYSSTPISVTYLAPSSCVRDCNTDWYGDAAVDECHVVSVLCVGSGKLSPC